MSVKRQFCWCLRLLQGVKYQPGVQDPRLPPSARATDTNSVSEGNRVSLSLVFLAAILPLLEISIQH